MQRPSIASERTSFTSNGFPTDGLPEIPLWRLSGPSELSILPSSLMKEHWTPCCQRTVNGRHSRHAVTTGISAVFIKQTTRRFELHDSDRPLKRSIRWFFDWWKRVNLSMSTDTNSAATSPKVTGTDDNAKCQQLANILGYLGWYFENVWWVCCIVGTAHCDGTYVNLSPFNMESTLAVKLCVN